MPENESEHAELENLSKELLEELDVEVPEDSGLLTLGTAEFDPKPSGDSEGEA